MGWTKRGDAVRHLKKLRKARLRQLQELASQFKDQNKCPELGTGEALLELAVLMHTEAKAFTKLREMVRGDLEVEIDPYVQMILQVIPRFKWSVYAEEVQLLSPPTRVHRDR